MGANAASLFRCRFFADFDLPVINIFQLLHESGATPENVKAVSSILNDEHVFIRSNVVELEAWANLLSEKDCPIRSVGDHFNGFLTRSIVNRRSGTISLGRQVQFQWVNTETSEVEIDALDRFFTVFQTNGSVACLTINSSIGLAPNEKQTSAMAAYTAQALKKLNLRHFRSVDSASSIISIQYSLRSNISLLNEGWT